jgi:hypothetical protein
MWLFCHGRIRTRCPACGGSNAFTGPALTMRSAYAALFLAGTLPDTASAQQPLELPGIIVTAPSPAQKGAPKPAVAAPFLAGASSGQRANAGCLRRAVARSDRKRTAAADRGQLGSLRAKHAGVGATGTTTTPHGWRPSPARSTTSRGPSVYRCARNSRAIGGMAMSLTDLRRVTRIGPGARSLARPPECGRNAP